MLKLFLASTVLNGQVKNTLVKGVVQPYDVEDIALRFYTRVQQMAYRLDGHLNEVVDLNNRATASRRPNRSAAWSRRRRWSVALPARCS